MTVPVRESLSELITLRVFGSEDLTNKLSHTPIEFTLKIPTIKSPLLTTRMELTCLSWNQIKRYVKVVAITGTLVGSKY